MIARDHDGSDAGGHAFAHRCSCFGARRIDQSDQSKKAQTAFNRLDFSVGLWQPFMAAPRYGQHPQTLRGQSVRARQPAGVVDADRNAFADVLAQRNDRFWRALGIGHKSLRSAMDGSHALAVSIEWLLVHAQPLGVQRGFVEAGICSHVSQCRLGRVAQPAASGRRAGIVAQGHCAQQFCIDGVGRHAGKPGGGCAFACREQALCLHAVLRQRAGFIRADGGDRPQCFDRWQATNQCVEGNHLARSEREQHRHHGRQRLRNGRDCQAHGDQDHLQWRLAAQHSHRKDDRADCQYGQRHPLAKRGEAQLQRCAAVSVLLQQSGHLAQFSGHAGRHDQSAAASVRGCGSLEGHVEPVPQRMHRAREYSGLLGYRDRFTGKSRFIDSQLCDVDQPQVGRHLVASLQQHDVARHQGLRRNLLQLAAAQHGRLGGCQALQRRQRLVGAPGLYQSDGRIEQHDDQNHQGIDQIADYARNYRRCD